MFFVYIRRAAEFHGYSQKNQYYSVKYAVSLLIMNSQFVRSSAKPR